MPMATDATTSQTLSAPSPRQVVVVLGMHRSGTSAVAGCLQRLGVDFGPRLMPANDDNPRGYYEHIDLVNLHDRLLLALGRSWDDVYPFPPHGWQDAAVRYIVEARGLLQRDFPAAPLWGLKDPRLCRLLPWWEPLWEASNSTPLFLLVRRAPSEVAVSLARREGFSFPKSYLLWLQHALEAERGTRGHRRAMIDFKSFVADWRGTLDTAVRSLGLPLIADSPDAGQFVDPALMRSVSTEQGQEKSPVWVEETDAALRLGLAGREDEMRSEMDRVTGLVRAADPLYLSTPGEAAVDLLHQLEAARRQASWYEAEWQKARERAEKAKVKLADRRGADRPAKPNLS